MSYLSGGNRDAAPPPGAGAVGSRNSIGPLTWACVIPCRSGTRGSASSTRGPVWGRRREGGPATVVVCSGWGRGATGRDPLPFLRSHRHVAARGASRRAARGSFVPTPFTIRQREAVSIARADELETTPATAALRQGRSAGEVQRHRRPSRVELAEPDDRAVRREALDLHTALAQTVKGQGLRAHL